MWGRGKETSCGSKRNGAEQRGYCFRLLPLSLILSRRPALFLPEAGATYDVHRVTAFPRGFIWDPHQAGAPST